MSEKDNGRDGHHVAPAVLGAAYAGREAEEPVETFFVLSQRVAEGDLEATLELRRTDDDRLAVMAYSSLQLLIAACGEAQPWIAVAAERIDEVQSRTGADVVLYDVELPPELRHEEGDEHG